MKRAPIGMHRRFLALLLPVLTGCAAGAPEHEHEPPAAWDRVPVTVQGRLALDAPAEGLAEAQVVGGDEIVYLRPAPEFSNEHLRHADADADADPLVLRLWFTTEGAERVAGVTAAHPGSRFALTVNGHVVSAPAVVRAMEVDPAVPVAVEVHLPPEDAGRLAAAVARTWPPDSVPAAPAAAP